ncbi:MAG TPA: universal stress protein [Pseudonocardiaceae bacterium]|nr:universal stress protein [Pseudonocardiaceae bacterium]
MDETSEQQYTFEIGKDGLSTIVIGYDDTPPALDALAWAAGLARRDKARMVIVYVEVLSSPAYWVAAGAVAANEAAGEIVQELHRRFESLLTSQGLDWELLHGKGDPAGVLEAVAEEKKADCIVVGRSRHRGGLLGSVPRGLLAKAARPVIVVP